MIVALGLLAQLPQPPAFRPPGSPARAWEARDSLVHAWDPPHPHLHSESPLPRVPATRAPPPGSPPECRQPLLLPRAGLASLPSGIHWGAASQGNTLSPLSRLSCGGAPGGQQASPGALPRPPAGSRSPSGSTGLWRDGALRLRGIRIIFIDMLGTLLTLSRCHRG